MFDSVRYGDLVILVSEQDQQSIFALNVIRYIIFHFLLRLIFVMQRRNNLELGVVKFVFTRRVVPRKKVRRARFEL